MGLRALWCARSCFPPWLSSRVGFLPDGDPAIALCGSCVPGSRHAVECCLSTRGYGEFVLGASGCRIDLVPIVLGSIAMAARSLTYTWYPVLLVRDVAPT